MITFNRNNSSNYNNVHLGLGCVDLLQTSGTQALSQVSPSPALGQPKLVNQVTGQHATIPADPVGVGDSLFKEPHPVEAFRDFHANRRRDQTARERGVGLERVGRASCWFVST